MTLTTTMIELNEGDVTQCSVLLTSKKSRTILLNRPLGYEREYCEVADIPFHIQVAEL